MEAPAAPAPLNIVIAAINGIVWLRFHCTSTWQDLNLDVPDRLATLGQRNLRQVFFGKFLIKPASFSSRVENVAILKRSFGQAVTRTMPFQKAVRTVWYVLYRPVGKQLSPTMIEQK